MKFSLKTIAAAVVMAAAAASANAAIWNGADNTDETLNGNGELMFSAWDGQTSYVYDMNVTIDSFEASLNAGGNLNLIWNNDFTTSYSNWVSSANQANLKWNILAVDSVSQHRILTTVDGSLPTQNNAAGTLRSLVQDVQTKYLNNLNPLLGWDVGHPLNPDGIVPSTSFVTNSITSEGYAGKIGDKLYNKTNFDTSGSFASNSYASGLGFEKTLANASGTTKGTNTAYVDGTAVRAWVAADNTLHIAAVPEPSEYAMLLAGLSMIGFLARRRKSA